jgi:hypothetical protein
VLKCQTQPFNILVIQKKNDQNTLPEGLMHSQCE